MLLGCDILSQISSIKYMLRRNVDKETKKVSILKISRRMEEMVTTKIFVDKICV